MPLKTESYRFFLNTDTKKQVQLAIHSQLPPTPLEHEQPVLPSWQAF